MMLGGGIGAGPQPDHVQGDRQGGERGVRSEREPHQPADEHDERSRHPIEHGGEAQDGEVFLLASQTHPSPVPCRGCIVRPAASTPFLLVASLSIL